LNGDLVVRALTYFTKGVNTREDLEDEISMAEEVLGVAEKALLGAGYKVFTKRVSLPGVDRGLARALVDYAGRGVLLSAGYSKTLGVDDVIELALNGIYVPVLYTGEPSFEEAKAYSTLFHKVSSRDPASATKIAIGMHGEEFQSPYFPDSSSKGSRCIGLAFLYPKKLVNLLAKGAGLEEAFEQVFSEVKLIVKAVGDASNLPIIVDYSLSPWMDNSVGELYEASGHSLLSPSAVYYTWLLNKAIWGLSDPSTRSGFNEVMLPYAEDNVLREYGSRGLLRARDFLAYASTCVAGVDMVVVPEDVDKLARLIASTMAIAWVKSRPISLRAIPVPAGPGDLWGLGRFGRVPVIPY